MIYRYTSLLTLLFATHSLYANNGPSLLTPDHLSNDKIAHPYLACQATNNQANAEPTAPPPQQTEPETPPPQPAEADTSPSQESETDSSPSQEARESTRIPCQMDHECHVHGLRHCILNSETYLYKGYCIA